MTTIAINGLGRIGRAALKIILDTPQLDLVAVNDIVPIKNIVYLLKYDSVYGRYTGVVEADSSEARTWLRLGGHRVRLLSERDPAALPWRALNVDIVVEATGAFDTYAAARRHLEAGSTHVCSPHQPKTKTPMTPGRF